MYMVSAVAPRELIEAAANALGSLDPSPADAIDTKEETRTLWRLAAYAADFDAAYGCVGIIEYVTPTLSPVVTKLEDMDWVTLSLEGLPAVYAGPFVVGGAHELAKGHPGRIPLWIEAGPAFGTGHHGTTAGCLLALEQVARRKPPKKVFDIGTGSGVLAIAAIKRGSKSAIASDMDAESVRVARINAANNKVRNQIKFVTAMGTASSVVQTGAPYDLIFANILAPPLIKMSGDLTKILTPGGSIILSGLLTHQEPLVRAAFAGRGLKLANRIRRDGWSTLTYEKPKKRVALPKAGPQSEARRLIEALNSGDKAALRQFDGFEDVAS